MGQIIARKTAKGETRYMAQVRVRRRGEPVIAKAKTFTSRDRAERWLKITEGAIAERRELPGREAQTTTVADAVNTYVESEVFRTLSAEQQIRRAQQLRSWVAALPERLVVADLKSRTIEDAGSWLRREHGISSATLNRYMAALSGFCTWLVKRDMLTQNPARAERVDRGPERQRELLLTPNERRRLLAACKAEGPTLHALVVLALNTGGRKGEILGLKWSEVELSEGRVRFLRTKNGEPRSLPLQPQAIEVFRQLQKVRHMDGTVFGGIAFPEHAWERARRAARLDKLPPERIWRHRDLRPDDKPGPMHYHDLRHCYATALAEAGATLSELKHALGHKTLSQVIRYQHLTERATENAIRDRLAGVELA